MASAATLALAACSSSSSTSTEPSSVPIAAGGTDLSSVCPANIVVQTSWYPQAETGYLFELIKDDYTVDAGQKSVSGPLTTADGPTGVTIEVRAGGPAIGFQQPASQMYTDPSITFALVGEDQAIQLSGKFPVLSVFAPLERGPLMVMWDPATYPDVTTIAELDSAMDDTGGVILYSQGLPYMDYLLSSGQVSESHLDGSYDGTPATFIAADGRVGSQAYSTNEDYTYEYVIEEWMKPVDFQLLADAGWDPYPAPLAIRAGDKEELSSCLEQIVPIMQQATVDFFNDPSGASAVILDQVEQFQTGNTYSQSTIDAAVATMIEDELVGNGSNSTTGDFDTDRLANFWATAAPLFTSLGSAPADDASPETLFTNEYIDPSIGF